MDMKPFALKNFINVACGELGWKKYASCETNKAFAEHNGITESKATSLGYKVMHRARMFMSFKKYELPKALFMTQVYYYTCTIDMPASEQSAVANVICRNFSTAESFLSEDPKDFIRLKGVGKKYAHYMTLVQDMIRRAGCSNDANFEKFKMPSYRDPYMFDTGLSETVNDDYLATYARGIIYMLKRVMHHDSFRFFTINDIRNKFGADVLRDKTCMTYGYDEADADNIDNLIQYRIVGHRLFIELYNTKRLLRGGELYNESAARAKGYLSVRRESQR